jgi:hypothetical protein
MAAGAGHVGGRAGWGVGPGFRSRDVRAGRGSPARGRGPCRLLPCCFLRDSFPTHVQHWPLHASTALSAHVSAAAGCAPARGRSTSGIGAGASSASLLIDPRPAAPSRAVVLQCRGAPAGLRRGGGGHPAALPRGRPGAGPPTGAAAAEAVGRQVHLWPQGRTVVWCRATAGYNGLAHCGRLHRGSSLPEPGASALAQLAAPWANGSEARPPPPMAARAAGLRSAAQLAGELGHGP